MFQWIFTAFFATLAPLILWDLQRYRPDASQSGEDHRTVGADDWKRAFANIFWTSSDDGFCHPDFLSCMTDKSYAARCPLACENINVFSKLLKDGKDDDVATWVTKRLGLESPEKNRATRGWWPHTPDCGKCPHVNCCVGYRGTLAEAALTASGYWPTKQDQSSDMMFSLSLHYVTSWWFRSDPVRYYDSTLKYYGEGCARADIGWGNEFFGTMQAYLNRDLVDLGVHAYRKVPKLADGLPDFDFSVTSLPKPSGGSPLVVGVLADWGCGNAGARRVMEELKKQKPDILLHLGDTYYSGTKEEQIELFLNIAREYLGDVPIMNIPGNHDYYSNGSGFHWLIDELAKTQGPKQNASYVALRNDDWQILMLDTGILDSFQLNDVASLIPLGEFWEKMQRETMAFLPDDQVEWALKQIKIGKAKGLKTIVMTHHQLFSRHVAVGYTNGVAREVAFSFDVEAGIYETTQWKKRSTELPGKLPPDVQPAVNTRLLDQFPSEMLADVSAWFWGHEHAATIFKPYAGLQKGRLIGHGCIPVPKPPIHEMYNPSKTTVGTPWGGHPEVMENSAIGFGHNFWNLGFATITLDGNRAHAKYFQLEDYMEGTFTGWKDATVYFEEDL